MGAQGQAPSPDLGVMMGELPGRSDCKLRPGEGEARWRQDRGVPGRGTACAKSKDDSMEF